MSTFETFDFEKDPRWNAYAEKYTTTTPESELRLKQRFYRIYIETNDSASSSSSSSAKPKGSTTQPRDSILNTSFSFSLMNCCRFVCLVCGVLAILFYSKPTLYFLSLGSGCFTFAVSIFFNVRTKGFSMSLLSSEMMTADGLYSTWCLIFVNVRSTTALIPPMCFSLIHLANSFAGFRLPLVRKICGFVNQRVNSIAFFVVFSELFALFTIRKAFHLGIFAGIFHSIWLFFFINMRYIQSPQTAYVLNYICMNVLNLLNRFHSLQRYLSLIVSKLRNFNIQLRTASERLSKEHQHQQ